MKKDTKAVPYEVTLCQDTIEKFGSKEAKFTWVIGRAIERGVSIPEKTDKTA